MTAPKVAHVTTIDLTLRNLLFAQLRALRDHGFDVTGISAPGPWAAELEAEGIRHIAWHNATRAWNPRADAKAFAELYRIFRRERFDVVHTHNPKPGIMGRIAGRVARVPCIANTVHGLYATPEDRLRKRIPILGLEWLSARFSDVELYQSREDVEWVRRIRLAPSSRVRLLGNGTDLSRFDPASVSAERRRRLREDLGIPADALVVGTIGRLVAEKGYREIFEAAPRVRREVPEARFLVVGDADLDKADAITTAELDAAAEHVTFAGWSEDVPAMLAAMDLFILASWREGMPRSAIEAAAMGVPLVLTDIRGCREVVDDGEQGVLVPVRDPAALAAAIAGLLQDPQRRSRMGRAARAKALEAFDEGRVARAIVAETVRMLEEKGRPVPAPRPEGDRV
ncbi:MAG: glycosyltransferase family 4 protein [Actinomycetota bacterium]|nr:glycosyltransferase family 4 protein [Actinomycetota bacterium]